ncbi:MAG: DUF2161 family putative PD-(D/E)XK-type phosphodiesterase [Clostridiaceae bacterium]|nr:DUF2161 family putative PD-(D/E)XK-type phosphodiesterase [Clostridiaceae bacterium]
MNIDHQEHELYDPVRQFWLAAGYDVRGEVVDCDVVAMRGEDLVAVEMKLRLNLDVIIQATQRQRLCPEVWIAVARPDNQLRSRRWQHLLHVLRRLELGLLLVDLDRRPSRVEVALLPEAFDRGRSLSGNKARREHLRREFANRHGDRNAGGVHRTPLMTVYREQALLIASLLQDQGSAGAADLRQKGAPDKTYSILYQNHYQWFEKQDYGLYRLSDAGQAALSQYGDLAEQLRAGLSDAQNDRDDKNKADKGR